MGDKLCKIVYFKNQKIVKLFKIQFIKNCKASIHSEKPKKKNKKKTVLFEIGFQLFF